MKVFLTIFIVLIAMNLFANEQDNLNEEKCPSKCVKINLDERYAPEWCCKVLMCNKYTFNKTTGQCDLSETKAEEYPVPCLQDDEEEI